MTTTPTVRSFRVAPRRGNPSIWEVFYTDTRNYERVSESRWNNELDATRHGQSLMGRPVR
jgi:hypothetical protein